jgi:hypothetical protein
MSLPGSDHLLSTVRWLGAFRRANAWLASATLDDVTTHAGALTYTVTGDGGSLRVRVNPAAHTVSFPHDDQRPNAVRGTVIAHPDRIDLPANGWAVHRTNEQESAPEGAVVLGRHVDLGDGARGQ